MEQEEGTGIPTEVQPHLFLGDKKVAKDLDKIKELGITYVVNVTHELRNYFEHEPLFKYLKCDVLDSDQADISQYFEAAGQFIDEGLKEGNGVLVHCQQGISRSASVVIAYLMKYQGMKLSEAYTHLKKNRSQVKPKPNFLTQLVKYEKQLKAAAATRAKSGDTNAATAAGSDAKAKASPKPDKDRDGKQAAEGKLPLTVDTAAAGSADSSKHSKSPHAAKRESPRPAAGAAGSGGSGRKRKPESPASGQDASKRLKAENGTAPQPP